MDIFHILRIEHASVQNLLDDLIEQTGDKDSLQTANGLGRDWTDLLLDLKLSLVTHNRAEEAVVYDVLRQIPHRNETAELKTEEHHLAEEMLEDLEEINPADKQWGTKLALLKNQIESHIAEEETTIFSLLEPYVTDDMSDKMVIDFQTLRDELYESASYHPKGRSFVNPAGLDLDRNT